MCILYPTPSINQEILDEVHRCWEKEAFSFHLLPFFFYINIINNIHFFFLKKRKKSNNIDFTNKPSGFSYHYCHFIWK